MAIILEAPKLKDSRSAEYTWLTLISRNGLSRENIGSLQEETRYEMKSYEKSCTKKRRQ